jgi:hypothetical protein
MSKGILWCGLGQPSRWLLSVAIVLNLPTTVFGQSGEDDVGEVAVFGGGSFGNGSHPVVGGSTGTAFSRYGMALVEAAFMPMGTDTLRRQTNISGVQDSKLFDFNLSFHIRIPVRERWAPYGILGAGFIFQPFQAIVGSQGALVGIEDYKFAFHTGAGVRYYIRQDWGIRPEFKVIIGPRTFTRFSVGFFYNLPPNWI